MAPYHYLHSEIWDTFEFIEILRDPVLQSPQDVVVGINLSQRLYPPVSIVAAIPDADKEGYPLGGFLIQT